MIFYSLKYTPVGFLHIMFIMQYEIIHKMRVVVNCSNLKIMVLNYMTMEETKKSEVIWSYKRYSRYIIRSEGKYILCLDPLPRLLDLFSYLNFKICNRRDSVI